MQIYCLAVPDTHLTGLKSLLSRAAFHAGVPRGACVLLTFLVSRSHSHSLACVLFLHVQSQQCLFFCTHMLLFSMVIYPPDSPRPPASSTFQDLCDYFGWAQIQDNFPIWRYLITSAKSPFLCKVIYLQVQEMRTWTSFGATFCLPHSSNPFPALHSMMVKSTGF